MPLNWKLFRVACYLQIIMGSILSVMSLINMVRSFGIGPIIGILLFLLMMALATLGLNLLSKNYPDTPVSGKQKTNFNRLYLINFLFLVFLFAFVFSEWRTLNTISQVLNRSPFDMPFEYMIPLIANIVILILHMIILYGLFVLRRELYENFQQKRFEFEK